MGQRRRNLCTLRAIVVLVVAGSGSHLPAQTRLIEFASGLAQPLFLTHATASPEWVYVVEQGSGGSARFRAIHRESGALSTVATLTGLTTGGERGFLGAAFDPDHEDNGWVYLYTSVPRQGSSGDHDSLIRRFTMDSPTSLNVGSARTVLRFNQDFANHNGGWMGFGPDGLLYIATGDGGNGGDPNNRSQDTDSLLGKILRIDPGGDDFPDDDDRNYAIPAGNLFVGIDGRDEIWAYGVRNPWRCSFDRGTGDFVFGDVGQSAREEINFAVAGSGAGHNFGWRIEEGTLCFDDSGAGGNMPCGDASLRAPIYDYSHGFGATQGRSVTGGYVYRGPSPSLQGAYFFGDFVNRRVWSLRIDRSAGVIEPESFIDWTDELNATVDGSIGPLASFGEDADGNLYLLTFDGIVYLLVAEPGPVVASIGTAGGDGIRLSFQGLTPDATNLLERTTDLADPGSWSQLDLFQTRLGWREIMDTPSGESESRAFYRLVTTLD